MGIEILTRARRNRKAPQKEIGYPMPKIPEGVTPEEFAKLIADMPVAQVIKDDMLKTIAKGVLGQFFTQKNNIGEQMTYETFQSIAHCNHGIDVLSKMLTDTENPLTPEQKVACIQQIGHITKSKGQMIELTVEMAKEAQSLTTKMPTEKPKTHSPPTFAVQINTNTKTGESTVKAITPDPATVNGQ